MPRMKIFNSLEIEAFDSPPVFNSSERKRFFYSSSALVDAIANLRTPTNKVCFVATAGYFRARHRFFARQFHLSDIEYVARRLGLEASDVSLGSYDKATYGRHQREILDHYGYSPFDEVARVFAASEIAALVRVQFRPKLILLAVIEILTGKKIEIPSYSSLADLIVAELSSYRENLEETVANALNDSQRQKLDELLEKEPGPSADGGWRYRLTLMKKPHQSSSPSKVKANLADLKTLQGLYLDLKPVWMKLQLSSECVRYYAYSVIKAQIPQVSRRANEGRYLHLIAFIIHQTFKLNDILVDTMLGAVRSAGNAAEKEHRDSYFQERERRSHSLSALVDKLKLSLREMLSAVREIVADSKLSDAEKVARIDAKLSLIHI